VKKQAEVDESNSPIPENINNPNLGSTKISNIPNKLLSINNNVLDPNSPMLIGYTEVQPT
jgi:hypothetical protein